MFASFVRALSQAGYVGYTTFNKDWIGKKYWYNIGYPIDLYQVCKEEAGTRTKTRGNAVKRHIADRQWVRNITSEQHKARREREGKVGSLS